MSIQTLPLERAHSCPATCSRPPSPPAEQQETIKSIALVVEESLSLPPLSPAESLPRAALTLPLEPLSDSTPHELGKLKTPSTRSTTQFSWVSEAIAVQTQIKQAVENALSTHQEEEN